MAMEDKETDFVVDMDSEMSETSETEELGIPFTDILTGFAESVIGNMVSDDKMREQVFMNYERSMAILKLIHFDEAMSRKILSGQMDDKTIITFGLIYFGVTTGLTVLMIRPPKWLSKMKGRNNDDTRTDNGGKGDDQSNVSSST
ncbi:MAG TPA: hypothetical protein VIL29_05430 [Pseudothermotoga sp.]